MEENNQVKEKKSKTIYWIIPIILLIIGSGVFYMRYNQEDDIGSINDLIKTNGSFEEKVCSMIKATPSWVRENGVVDQGYSNFEGADPKEIVNLLIQSQTYLVYHEDCGWCKSQIAYFGSEWGRYVASGYTIDCKYI